MAFHEDNLAPKKVAFPNRCYHNVHIPRKASVVMGDYHTPGGGTMEIIPPEGHIVLPEGCIIPPEGRIMHHEGGIMRPKGGIFSNWPEGRGVIITSYYIRADNT